MTTATSAPLMSLGLPAPVDKMDISSPYSRNLDDFDIDIDIPSKPSDHDEDLILEESRSDAARVYQSGQDQHTDDVMIDEERQSVLSEDRTMRDDDTVQDEHLTDASDVGVEEIIVNEAKAEEAHLTNALNTVNELGNDVAQDLGDAGKDVTLEAPPAELQSHNNEFNLEVSDEVIDDNRQIDIFAASPSPQLSEDDVGTPTAVLSEGHPPDKGEESTNHNSFANEDELDAGEHVASESHSDQAQPIEGDARAEPEIREPDMSNEPLADNGSDVASETVDHDLSGSFTTPLHPVTVHYDGNDISLFPPSDDGSSETYLLADENLVNVSITDLLRACRVVLGDTVDEVDELVLSIEALGISLSEVNANAIMILDYYLHAFQECLYAASTSFNDILNVYTNLKQLDGLDAEPLYITLSLRPRFSIRFQALQAAISDGKGLSHIKFLSEAPDAELEQEDDDLVHNEKQKEHKDTQAEPEGNLPSDRLPNLPAHDPDADEGTLLEDNQASGLHDDEKELPSTAQAAEGVIDDTNVKENQEKELSESGVINYQGRHDLDQAEDDDDLVIYGEDERSVDLPLQESATSESSLKSSKETTTHGMVSDLDFADGDAYLSQDETISAEEISTELITRTVADGHVPGHEQKADPRISEAVVGDEDHNDTVFEDDNDHDDRASNSNPSYYDDEDSAHDSKFDKPSEITTETDHSSKKANEVDEAKISKLQFESQEGYNHQISDVSENVIVSEDPTEIPSPRDEDAFIPQAGDDSYDDDNPDLKGYKEPSTLSETDLNHLSDLQTNEVEIEEIHHDLASTADSGRSINRTNDEEFYSHEAKDQAYPLKTSSPSTKRMRSTDADGSFEGEDTPADTKRIRSL